MPKQGLQMTEGTITKWLVPIGGKATEGEPLFEMETDKLTITINSNFTGTLLKTLAEEGDVVPITAPIALIGDSGEVMDAVQTDVKKIPETSDARYESKPEIPAAAEPVRISQKAVPLPAASAAGRKFATPRARTRAGERGIDIRAVTGSGPEGLVTERDVIAFKPAEIVCARAEKMWVRADFSAVGLLIARGTDLDMPKMVRRAVKAAFTLSPELGEAFGETLSVEIACGADGFEAALPDGVPAVLSVAINGGSALLTLTYTDAKFRESGSVLLGKLKTLLDAPELMLCV